MTPLDLSALVAEHVAGYVWIRFPERSYLVSSDSQVAQLKTGSRGRHRDNNDTGSVPPYATSADAVLPLLDAWRREAKSKYREGHIYWQAGTFDEQNSRDYWVELCGMIGGIVAGQGPTLPEAACRALLAAAEGSK